MLSILTGLTWAGVGKKLLSALLNPRTWLYLLLLAVVLYSGYKTYSWIYERGAQSRQQEINTLTEQRDKAIRERNQARAEKAAYAKAWKEFVRNSEEATRQLKEENAATVNRLTARLKTLEKRSQTTRDLAHEIPQYVTPQADSRCVVPVGFVRLFNESIEGQAGTRSADGPLPEGAGGDAAAPSGLALSQVADAIVYNHDEAVRRGVIIQLWQQWYTESRDQFTKAQQLKADSIPRVIVNDTATPSPTP